MGLKFDRSEPGFWVSGAVHTALLAGLVFGVASQTFPEAEEGIPVEVLTDNQLSEITRGESNAKAPQPEAKPRADRVAEVREERDPGEAKREVPTPPTRPAEIKIAEEAVEVSVPPPPPVPPIRPEPSPPQQAEAKPEPAPPMPPKREEVANLLEEQEAELRAKAEAQAKSEAEARARAEAKAKAEAAKARAVAEAKAKAEAEAEQKRIAEARAEAEHKKKARRSEGQGEGRGRGESQARRRACREVRPQRHQDAPRLEGTGAILGLDRPRDPEDRLARHRDRRGAAAESEPARRADGPSARPAASLLAGTDRRPRRGQAAGAEVRVSLNQDGSLAREPAVTNASADPLFRAVADSATRAARRCSPLRIPAQFQPYYQDWKDLVVNFDPRDLG